jgi:hypothetical protein
MGSQVPFDFVVQFGVVKSSSLLEEPDTGRKTGVLYTVEGIGLAGERGEVDSKAESFGSLGIVGRPLPPTVAGNRSTHMEVACLRTADGLVPISARDLRLRMGGDGPGEGTIAIVGYGGGFHSLSPAGGDPDNGTIHIIYCPYDFDSGGVAQKAHVIVLDPTAGNESVSIVHAEGQCILLQSDGSARMQSPDGQSYVQVADGKVSICSDQIFLTGSVFVGSSMATTYPIGLLPGIASQACPRLFLSAL